ncbi:MAG: relaxase/mobilization nuclease domain-containing protein [Flavobacteriales bacterium]|nr:MAG: relaxase/mobilization nuclease domain-containing protein [Flavobacteriales bacterium]
MICKMAIISEKHTLNSLEYAERGGELLSTQLVYGTPKEIYKDFQLIQALNDRAVNKSIHAIISLNPKDDLSKLTNQDLIDIGDQYMIKQGFDNNQSATYIHRDKEHLHLHIVANRINLEGKCTSSSHNYAKNIEFSKQMEEKYQLINTNRKVKGVDFVKDNARANIIREKIHKSLVNSNSIEQFCAEMKNQQVLVIIGRGISFIDSSGTKFKGSEVGREYSLLGIQKMLSKETTNIYQEEITSIKVEPKNIDTDNNQSVFMPTFDPKQFITKDDDDEDESRFKKKKRGLSR